MTVPITAETPTEECAQVADWQVLDALSKTLLKPGSLEQKLQEAMAIVCGFHRTNRSVISLFSAQSGTLGVRASLGMDVRSLSGLHGVAPGNGACGLAFSSMKRFIVPEFGIEPCLRNYRPWAEEFSIQAVYSTPFFDSSHTAIGVLSLYFDALHLPTEREMQLSDACAGTIALFLERARVEESVAMSEVRYRVLAQCLAAIIWRYDPGVRRFLDVYGWNDFTGQSLTEYTQKNWIDTVHEDDRERVRTLWIASHVAQTPYECTHRLRYHDGSYRYVRTVGTPITIGDNGTKEWVGSCEDVTEAHDARDALRIANRRKDEFLAVLSHELRNPLAAAGAAAELLQQPEGAKPRAAYLGQVIRRQIGHMSRLVEDLIDVSRIAEGLVVLDQEALNLHEIVDAALEQVLPMFKAKHHSYQVLTCDGPWVVIGDRTRLIQVVVNLLSNAARYTPDNGHFTISLVIEGEDCCLTVSDNGIGIDPTELPTLFNMFIQSERSSKRTTGGLGLGLALVKNLVELHGGTVSVSSGGKHLGSSFSIRIPLLARNWVLS